MRRQAWANGQRCFMENACMRTGAVILAGGKSRRMGRNKAQIEFGGVSFLCRIARELEDFEERLLSVGIETDAFLPGFESVKDLHTDSGAIAGLYAAIMHCRSDALLVVPCDVPLYKRSLGDCLLGCLREGYDAAVAVTRDGRIHPYCGAYRKNTSDILLSRIDAGELRMLDALPLMRTCYMRLSDRQIEDQVVTNINTPEAYKRLIKSM